jgi:hypothetical protein
MAFVSIPFYKKELKEGFKIGFRKLRYSFLTH